MKKLSKNESKVFTLGIQFVASVIVFWYIGSLLDVYFETSFLQIVGIFFGITGSIIKLILVVRELDNPKVDKTKD